MKKLTTFLLAEQTLNQRCPGIQTAKEAVTKYFNGVAPKINTMALTVPGELERDVAGRYNTVTHDIEVEQFSHAYVGIHEMVHGVLSAETNSTEIMLEEWLVDAVTMEIAQSLNIPQTYYKGYEAGREALEYILKALKMTTREFANKYLASVNVADQSKWVTDFIINEWKNQGYPHDLNWQAVAFFFNIEDVYEAH